MIPALHPSLQSVFRGRSQPWLLSNGLGDASFATRNDGTGYSNEIAGACEQGPFTYDVRKKMFIFCPPFLLNPLK